ncbi:hypothetical protein ABK040_001257 [Willaertia magna]
MYKHNQLMNSQALRIIKRGLLTNNLLKINNILKYHNYIFKQQKHFFSNNLYDRNLASTNNIDSDVKQRKRTTRATKKVLTLTDRAAERLNYLLSKRPDSIGIIIGLKKRGCNGLSWTFDYVTKETDIPKFAEVIEDKGIKIIVQPAAVMNVIGTEMDFLEDEISSKFVFNNPNAIGTCGCGESFNVATSINESKLQRQNMEQ